MFPAVSRLRVLHVVSELYPFVKTGGLADVAAALPAALRVAGVDARLLVPGYPAVLAAVQEASTVHHFGDLFRGGSARIIEARLEGSGVPAYVVDCPGLFQRDGGPYQDRHGADWPDNHRRFAALGWAAAALAGASNGELRPDVVHTHDWQAGLALAYIKRATQKGPPCVATIHSIAYPGSFEPDVLPELALHEDAYAIDGVEFFGRVSFLKAALYYADRITTVSPTYASEIQLEGQGGGFEGLLRARRSELVGILNGVDADTWDPGADPYLPEPYTSEDLRGKVLAKEALQRRAGLAHEPRTPLFGIVSRLVWQKGIDSVVEVIPWLVERGAQLVVLGSGDPALLDALQRLEEAYPTRVAAIRGHDEAIAHLVQGGADAILVPSRTEPCGLTQLYALRYGSPPVVRRTGGLADTVVDATAEALRSGVGTGFCFDDPTAAGLRGALERAVALYQQPVQWRQLQRAAMKADFGWGQSARKYADLYRSLGGD
jgi:starch synthase